MIFRSNSFLTTVVVGGLPSPNPNPMSYTSFTSPNPDKSGTPCFLFFTPQQHKLLNNQFYLFF